MSLSDPMDWQHQNKKKEAGTALLEETQAR
jgi:hypothetical protein